MKRAFTLPEALIVVAILLLLAAILFPVFFRARDLHRPSCQSPLKQIGMGFFQYWRDYDERLPPARVTASTGWADVLLPYVKSTQVFQCPDGQPPTQNSTTSFSSDYFYNRRLDRVVQSKLPRIALTIMGGDGDDNAPTWNSWTQLPADATTNSDSPPQRHKEGANYLFADGHVKLYKPGDISSTFASPTSRPTFAIR